MQHVWLIRRIGDLEKQNCNQHDTKSRRRAAFLFILFPVGELRDNYQTNLGVPIWGSDNVGELSVESAWRMTEKRIWFI